MFHVNPLMKNQALFSLKDKSKKLKCRLLHFLFGTLRVKTYLTHLLTILCLLEILGQIQKYKVLCLNYWHHFLVHTLYHI